MAASDWRTMKLGDLLSLQRGYDLPAGEQRPGSVPVIGSAGQAGYHDTARVKGPGVTIGRSGVGSMGMAHFCSTDFWPHNTTLFVTDFHGNDERFSFYLLSSLDLRRYNSGSAQASLNRNYIYPIKINVPPVEEQKKISRILGALDDKIDLNLRMNQTLEAMASAIFKSWFVDFDPVQEGHSLFPQHLADTRLGKTPAGWPISSIGEVATVVGGSTPSTSEQNFWNGPYHFATPKDMASLSAPALIETERTITEEGLSQIGSGLLPPGTVLLSSRAPIGYLAITEIPVAVNQGFIAMVCDRKLPNFYIFEWARQNMKTIIGHANGTTFLEISKRNFRPIPVLVPPSLVLDSFVAIVSPMFQKITANLRESRTLAALRDTLLPKLLSGEIRVKQA